MIEDSKPTRTPGPNWTTIALIGGLLLVVLLVAYFATNRNSDQDKLTNAQASGNAQTTDPDKLCASKATYDLIKRDLFRRAAELRGSDEAAFDKLAAFAVLRMENPVMENQDDKTGAVSCSGSLSVDLPPGVAVVGGRRTLTTDLDYVAQQAADGSEPVVMLRNADAIVTPLATLARSGENPPVAGSDNQVQDDLAPTPDVSADETASPPQVQSAPAPAVPSSPARSAPSLAKPGSARPSFNCASARTKGELAVCSDPGLAALDRNMATQFGRAMASASPDQQALLRTTGRRFESYRDRCPSSACIADSYSGRIREIRDIMESRWAPR